MLWWETQIRYNKHFGDITSKVSEVLIGYCSICNEKNLGHFLITVAAEVVGDFFKNLGEKNLMYQKNLQKRIKEPRTNLGYYSEHCYRSSK